MKTHVIYFILIMLLTTSWNSGMAQNITENNDSLTYDDGVIKFNFPFSWKTEKNLSDRLELDLGNNFVFYITHNKSFTNLNGFVAEFKSMREKDGATLSVEDVCFAGTYSQKLTETLKESSGAEKRVYYAYDDGTHESIIGYGGLESDFAGKEAGCLAVIKSVKYHSNTMTVPDKYSFDYPAIFKVERNYSAKSATDIKINCSINSSVAFPIMFSVIELRDEDKKPMDDMVKDRIKTDKKDKHKNMVVSDIAIGGKVGKQVKFRDDYGAETDDIFVESKDAMFWINYSVRAERMPAFPGIFNNIMAAIKFL